MRVEWTRESEEEVTSVLLFAVGRARRLSDHQLTASQRFLCFATVSSLPSSTGQSSCRLLAAHTSPHFNMGKKETGIDKSLPQDGSPPPSAFE